VFNGVLVTDYECTAYVRNFNAHPGVVHFTRDSESGGADGGVMLQQLLWYFSH
jgi:hypothetical protein